MKKNKKIKCLSLFSGGLDSMLAVKVLQEQDIEVTGICFVSNFFNSKQAEISADEIGIDLEIIDISEKILDIVKNPKCGYGKCLNPCIDCHSLMIQEAKKILKREKYSFIATGEVLGQRPFSQNKLSLQKVSSLGGVEILRPLSAKELEETEFEKKGLVDRKRLLDLSGRRREEHFKLAREYKIKKYPSPSGGCLLTDHEFSQRVGELLDKYKECNIDDVELLKYGRIFWLNLDSNWILVAVGRHKEDNERLEKISKKGDFMIKLNNIVGPTTIARPLEFELNNLDLDNNKISIPNEIDIKKIDFFEKRNNKEILNLICLLTGWYSTKARGKKIDFDFKKI